MLNDNFISMYAEAQIEARRLEARRAVLADEARSRARGLPWPPRKAQNRNGRRGFAPWNRTQEAR